MIPRLHPRGTSFKGTCSYVLHDTGAETRDRVDWAITENMASHVDDAWFEMFETAKAQALLKSANGVDARGRKTTNPVQHISLSWAATDKPSPEHMQETARSCLRALGLSEHEALIVGHSDKEHPHLHIVVNTIHPYTGRTADLKFGKLKLSRWAEAYEREHGIHCDERLKNNDDRKVVGQQRTQEASDILFGIARGEIPGHRAPYVPINDKSPHRGEWSAQRDGRALDKAAADILRRITRHDSTFSRQDLAKLVSLDTKGTEDFGKLMARIEGSKELVRLPSESERLSTQTMVQTEHRMILMARAMSAAPTHGIGKLPSRFAPEPQTLSIEQEAALQHVIGDRQLAAVVGYAGSGKSTMLGEARKVWEAAGYSVRGAALSGIAAQGLQAGAGIQSSTIHCLQWAWEHGKEELGPKSVVVIDEAGMIGSRQMEAVMASVRRAGAKLVLVGDPEQLRPIEAGAAFRAIVEDVGAARITEVRRQRTYWQQQATKSLADGKTADALQAYSDTGSIVGHESRVAAIGAVVAAWSADAKTAPSKSTIMLSSTNANVVALNARARRSMRENGKLGPDFELEAWEESIDKPRRTLHMALAVGDRLMFTKNDNRIGVKNGTLGTLATIGISQLAVVLDGPNGKEVVIDLDRHRNFTHGYAATIHKAQGVTADRVHVVAGRNMDRNLTYVALSRHRDAVSLHFGKDDFASRSHFEATLSRERRKDTTLDYSRGARETQPTRTAERARPLSIRDSFADSASKGSTSDRIREDMRRWRTTNGNRNRDFGREL